MIQQRLTNGVTLSYVSFHHRLNAAKQTGTSEVKQPPVPAITKMNSDAAAGLKTCLLSTRINAEQPNGRFSRNRTLSVYAATVKAGAWTAVRSIGGYVNERVSRTAVTCRRIAVSQLPTWHGCWKMKCSVRFYTGQRQMMHDTGLFIIIIILKFITILCHETSTNVVSCSLDSKMDNFSLQRSHVMMLMRTFS